MKKTLLTLFLFLLLFLAGCGKNDITLATVGNETTANAGSNKKAYLSELGSLVSLIPYDYSGGSYLAVIQSSDSSWADELWVVKMENSELVLVAEVAHNPSVVRNAACVSISQGEFIEVYCSSHSGNGSMLLIPRDDLKTPKYEFGVVDLSHEGYVSEETVDTYNLPVLEGMEKGYGYSFVYEGGYLKAEYKDLNGDGNTDIVFHGIKGLVADNRSETEDNPSPIVLFHIKKVYIYDSIKDEFVLSPDLNEEKAFDAVKY